MEALYPTLEKIRKQQETLAMQLKPTGPTNADIMQAQSVFTLLTLGVEVPADGIAKATDALASGAGLVSPLNEDDWTPKRYYSEGTTVTYAESRYLCIAAHIAQEDWTPDCSPTLWEAIQEAYAEWTQPAGMHDAYRLGDCVIHNGTCWASTTDGNAWEPGVCGWEAAQDEEAGTGEETEEAIDASEEPETVAETEVAEEAEQTEPIDETEPGDQPEPLEPDLT